MIKKVYINREKDSQVPHLQVNRLDLFSIQKINIFADKWKNRAGYKPNVSPPKYIILSGATNNNSMTTN
jgi:hypothetical protein